MARKSNGHIKLKDVVKLVKPTGPLIDKIMNDELKVAVTWETTLSNWREKFSSEKEAWEWVIDNVFYKDGRINNYMAILRNINNVDKVGVDEDHFNKVIAAIENKSAVKYSKQYPFRFYSALANTRLSNPFRTKLLTKALDRALNYSVENLPKLKGNTFISADVSGSMISPISQRSTIQMIDVACLMAAMANKFSENGVASVFGENFKVVTTDGNILADTDKLRKTQVGHSTNGYKAIEYLVDRQIEVARVIIFTDCELYDSNYGWGYRNNTIQNEWNKYKQLFPNAKLYVVNLNSYGDACVNPRDSSVTLVSGWSEKILDYISKREEGAESFVKEVESLGKLE